MRIRIFLPVFFFLLTGIACMAQQVLTRYPVKEGQEKKMYKLLHRYVKCATARKSNIMAEAYHEQDTVYVLWVIERWSSNRAVEKMKRKRKFGKLEPSATIFIKDLEPLSKQQWRRKPGRDDQPMTILLFVDSQPGTEAEFKAIYHEAMPQFRSERGVINYQLSELEADSTRFVTYEKFRNEAAFQYHLAFPPIQPVIAYLNTSIRKQPFQAGLHRLIPLTKKTKK